MALLTSAQPQRCWLCDGPSGIKGSQTAEQMSHLCIVYPHIPWLTLALPSSLGEKPLVVSLNMHAF